MAHNNPNQPERTARAPYNFIPLPEQVVKAPKLPEHDCYHDETKWYSGTITCEIETRSPLYTRTMLDPQDYAAAAENARQMLGTPQGREAYSQFFNHGDVQKPVIPGTTLRGMLRALVEIITWSKVDWVTNRKLVYRAVGDRTSLGIKYREEMLGANQVREPAMWFDYPSRYVKGGYLRQHNDDYYIQPAQEHLGETFVHVDYDRGNGVILPHGHHRVHDMFVKPERRAPSIRGFRGGGNLTLNLALSGGVIQAVEKNPPAGWVRAKMVESGQMGRYPAVQPNQHPKHMHCAIYEPKGPLPREGEEPPADWLRISPEIWDFYQEDLRIVRDRNNTPRKLTPGEPLFYLEDAQGALVYFGATMMFRLPYPRSPRDFIPPALRNPEDVDFADAIFGYVRDNPMQGDFPQHYAGRIRVGDATLAGAPDGLWLAEQPVTLKILSGPKPTTFQHYLEQDQPGNRASLRHYASETAVTKIRGNKLYWHRGPVGLGDIQDYVDDWSKDTQHTLVRPVKEGVKFTSRIDFDNLSAVELGALMWALRLPQAQRDACCHTLGMGKPLGMGAVKITPSLVLQSRTDRYTRLFDGERWNRGKLVAEADFIASFEAFMTDALGLQNSPFTSIPRIQMLLEMMKFPGPQKERTSYMSIAPDNEFKDRRVLPDPLAVAGVPAAQGQRIAVNTPGTAPRGERRDGIEVVVAPKPMLAVGTILTVQVTDISDPDDLKVKLVNFTGKKATGYISKKDTLSRRLTRGMLVRCVVTELEEDKEEITVFLKVAPKAT